MRFPQGSGYNRSLWRVQLKHIPEFRHVLLAYFRTIHSTSLLFALIGGESFFNRPRLLLLLLSSPSERMRNMQSLWVDT